MNLRKKMMSVFLICIMAAFIPLLLILNTRVKSLNVEQTKVQTMELINSKSTEIGFWLFQRISEVKIIHEFAFKDSYDPESLRPYLTRLNSSLSNQYGNLHEIFAVGTIDGKGWVNDNITIDISNRDYFHQVMAEGNENYVISEPLISRSDNQPIFIICYPLMNNQKVKTGFINGAVSLNKITEIASGIKVYDGFSWVMNKKGDIYSISRDELTRNHLSDEGLNAIIKESQSTNQSTLNLLNTESKKSTVFFSSIPYTGDWLLCTLVENKMLSNPTDRIINLVLYFGIIMLGIAILLTYFLSGHMLKPLSSLKIHMEDVADGNLDTYYEVTHHDEISVLGTVFNHMVEELRQLVDKVYQVENQKRGAELRALQSQINPHFLYNTLDTIQWKAMDHNAYDVADMIHELSELFRISLSDGRELIPVSTEIQHVRHYLEIQIMRYKDQFTYEIQVDEEANALLIPKIIIQPLVENAIYHGLKLKREKGALLIQVKLQGPSLLLLVEDNGVGMDEGKLDEIKRNLAFSLESEHYGLYNVNERLKLAFRDKYHITMESIKNMGTKITLELPQIKEGN